MDFIFDAILEGLAYLFGWKFEKKERNYFWGTIIVLATIGLGILALILLNQ